jgi:hypothetical protein
VTKYQQKARATYRAGDSIDEFWHPEIIAECIVINEEREAEMRQARSKIKAVVESVDDLEKEFRGTISIRFGFRGSIREEQKITRAELDNLLATMPPAEREEVKAEYKGTKRLFSKDGFKEWEDLKKQRASWVNQIKNFGIPFTVDGMTVVRIEKIPDVEILLDKVEKAHAELVAKLVEAYPLAIRPEVVKSKLYNPSDYPSVESVQARFKVVRQWAHFGVPEILKEIDMGRYEAERKRTAEMWQEVKQNGILALRKMVSEMVERLVEAVSPAEGGEKKRFYATSVSNLTDFFSTFENRNIAGDTELAEEVDRLKSLIEGKDLEKFKTDDSLRAQVKTAGTQIASRLQGMIVSASSRVIRFED